MESRDSLCVGCCLPSAATESSSGNLKHGESGDQHFIIFHRPSFQGIGPDGMCLTRD